MGALAPPNTRLGQLQRGRGAGWLAALARPEEAREDVLACVLADPRIDRQVESRDEYYAQLVAAVGAPVERIAERLRELAASGADERDAWLAIDVLRQLSARGDGRATETLELAADGPFGELARVREPVQHEPGQSPMERFRELRASMEASTTERLVELAASPTTREGRIAWQLLGERDHTALLPHVVGRLTALCGAAGGRVREHLAIIDYLEGLPAHRVMGFAREWLDEPWPLSLAAECLFALDAEPDDRERLLATARTAFESDDLCRLGSMLDALARIPDLSCVALLVAVGEQVGYSYARKRALRALAPLASDERAAGALHEGLWDCEAGARDVACSVADLRRPAAADRLQHIATDPFEDLQVREAAARRIAPKLGR